MTAWATIRAGGTRGGGEDMSEMVDIIFEVIFPEIAAHVPIQGGSAVRSLYRQHLAFDLGGFTRVSRWVLLKS